MSPCTWLIVWNAVSQKILSNFRIAKKNIVGELKNKNLLYKKIHSLTKTLKIDFNINKPKILISGINPHAGEKGALGNEELLYINPVIKKLKKNNINIDGPFSPDSIFNKVNIKKYDCYICIYHDQALIPFKLLTDFKGINYTGSLDIVRISPVHGTGYNLNIKKANSDSLYNCFKVINKIINNRKKIVQT